MQPRSSPMQKKTRRALSHIVSTLHGRYRVLGLRIGIWVTTLANSVCNSNKFTNSVCPDWQAIECMHICSFIIHVIQGVTVFIVLVRH